MPASTPADRPRFGFRRAEEHGVTPPVVEWGPHFQVRVFQDPASRGPSAYAEPFSRV
ncbi:hypothetical protein [Planotetraspora sp. GP83]|uniref:hypothetical protein n=1 Tax=Planotetraspora sp. GP83 TaxID=3156264 RepID=UPI0035187BD2